MIAALLLQAANPDVVVTAPPPRSKQVPATIVLEPAAMVIATCDTDLDGATTRDELRACIERIYPAKDPGLRYLDYGDWALRYLGDRTALPSPFEADRNGDGAVSQAELLDRFQRLFARFDRDDDRRVTRAELLTFRTAPVDRDGPANPPPPGKPKRAPRP